MSNYDVLYITDLSNTFCLTDHEALELELKLNVTKYGKLWAKIGDKLYDFFNNRLKERQIICTKEQFTYLNELYLDSRKMKKK